MKNATLAIVSKLEGSAERMWGREAVSRERSKKERDDGSWTSIVLTDFCHLECNINIKVISIIK